MKKNPTASELVDRRNLNNYKRWLRGQSDRLEGKPCAENHGVYLDGFYSPDAIIPDFLTHTEAARLRRQM
jgi:hypothetical protein